MVASKLSVKYQHLELITCSLPVIRNWWRSGCRSLLDGLPRNNGRRMPSNPYHDTLAKIVRAPPSLARQIFFLFGVNLPNAWVLAQIKPLFLAKLCNWSSIEHGKGRPVDARFIGPFHYHSGHILLRKFSIRTLAQCGLTQLIETVILWLGLDSLAVIVNCFSLLSRARVLATKDISP
jgi:hypothetical protein